MRTSVEQLSAHRVNINSAWTVYTACEQDLILNLSLIIYTKQVIVMEAYTLLSIQ